jgi:putative glutamine amidotransferase
VTADFEMRRALRYRAIMSDHTLSRPRIGVLGIDRTFDTAVGLSPHVCSRRQWIDRLVAAGGLPVIIPPRVERPIEYLDMVDAIVLPGGGDVDPQLYGQARHPLTDQSDTERDLWELELVQAALDEDRPILSICRGMQLLNVALGGTLHQHVPEVPGVSLEHFDTIAWDKSSHAITIADNSRLAQALAPLVANRAERPVRVLVNSIHHQSVCDLGRSLHVTALSEDGVIEAVESPAHRFVVGVQWHPELLADDRQALGLFRALVQSLQATVAA